MLVLTIFSLAIWCSSSCHSMTTLSALRAYDSLICVIFLADFGVNLARSHPKADYFITRRGWLDLLGSFPSLGSSRSPGSFVWPVSADWCGSPGSCRAQPTSARQDVLQNRGQYHSSSPCSPRPRVVRLHTARHPARERSPDANITTGGVPSGGRSSRSRRSATATQFRSQDSAGSRRFVMSPVWGSRLARQHPGGALIHRAVKALSKPLQTHGLPRSWLACDRSSPRCGSSSSIATRSAEGQPRFWRAPSPSLSVRSSDDAPGSSVAKGGSMAVSRPIPCLLNRSGTSSNSWVP